MGSIENEKTTTIKIDSEWLKRLDELADRAKLSRRQLMMNMVDVGIDQIDALKMLGFFKLGLLARQIDEKRGKAQGWEETGDIKPTPVTLKEVTWQRLDSLSGEGDLSRHQLVKNILYVGIEELELFGKAGIFQLNNICNFLGDSFKGIINDGQKALKAIHGK